MHDEVQAAHGYRKAAEQGGKTGLKHLGYAVIDWYSHPNGVRAGDGWRLRLAVATCSKRHSSPDAGAIAERRRTDELAKVAPMQACYYTSV